MHRFRRESGEGQMGCLIGLIIFAIAVFIAYKMIPVKVKNAEIRQVVLDEAKSGHDDARIIGNILYRAREENLPITEDNIKIRRGGGLIDVAVDYDVPIDFPGYTYKWHFHHETENPVF